MEAEHQYLVALKLFLIVGPLELILLQRDKRRDARARSAAPSGAGVGDAVRVRVRG